MMHMMCTHVLYLFPVNIPKHVDAARIILSAKPLLMSNGVAAKTGELGDA